MYDVKTAGLLSHIFKRKLPKLKGVSRDGQVKGPQHEAEEE